jgi:hypothetical protein
MIKIPIKVVEAVNGYLKTASGDRYVLTEEEWETRARAANERLAKAQEKILAGNGAAALRVIALPMKLVDREGGTNDR